MANPLTEAHLKEINTNLERLKDAEEQAKLAQQAGIDSSSTLKQIEEQRQQLLRIKQTYFPGR